MLKLLYFLMIGLIAGWASGKILKGKGFGLITNLIVGCIGAFFGGFLFSILGIYTNSLIGDLVFATLGALAFIFVLRYLKNAVP